MENLNQLTPNELRKDYYVNCLTINFEDNLISKEDAETRAMRYLVEGDTEKYEYLRKEILRVKETAKQLFPDIEKEE